MTVIPEFMALFLALSIYTGTYIAEVVRAGIQAVSHGQTEAAACAGPPAGPDAPARGHAAGDAGDHSAACQPYLSLTKNSSLAVAIGYPDLVATGGTVLNQTGQAIEIVGIWMVVYLTQPAHLRRS